MTTTSQMGTFYNPKKAASELRKYREKGPIPSTKALIDAIVAEGVEGATVLDIGGGIGAVQHELLAAGAAQVTSVDASASYLEAAREEASRRGVEDRVTYLHGDFGDLAESVSAAEIVTLDRVINVYPDWERLAGLAAGRAQRLFRLVYPRDTRIVRLVVFAMNVTLRRSGSRCGQTYAPRMRSSASHAITVWHLHLRETSGRRGTSPSFAACNR